jgi:hypothetical protein
VIGRPVELNPVQHLEYLFQCEADMAVQIVALAEGILVMRQLEEVTLRNPGI